MNLKRVLLLTTLTTLSGCASIQFIPEEVPSYNRPGVIEDAKRCSETENHMGALIKYCDLGDYKNARTQLRELKKDTPNDPFIFLYENFLRDKK